MCHAGKKKKSKNVVGKNDPGCDADGMKEKKKKKKSKLPGSPRPLSSTSHQTDDLPVHPLGSDEKIGNLVVGEVVPRNAPVELQIPADKSKISCEEKAGEKKKKKRVKKKGTEKENLTSNLAKEVSEELRSTAIDPSGDGKGSEKQEGEKKKNRKRSKVDVEGKSEPKKPKTKMSKSQLQDTGNSVHPLPDNLVESKSMHHSCPEFLSGADKRTGIEGSSKRKKPKSGSKCDSVEQSSQSSSSSQAMSASPQAVPSVSKISGTVGPSKPKKPKFGVTPAYSSSSSSQSSNPSSPRPATTKDKQFGKGVFSKPKKPAFGVRSPKSGGQQLSELAQELGDVMKKTEKEGSAVEEVHIPVVKAKKFVPVFSKNAQKA